jgi:peptidoglycan/LPS O-acetylase OafA/YrhL
MSNSLENPNAISTTVSPPTLPGRIPSLDGLRAVSILLVIVAHAVDPLAYPRLYSLIGHVGNYGVRIFFLISGFLITTLLLKEYQKHGSISIKNFYARRTIRIFPAFYFYVGVVILLANSGWIKLLPGDIFHTLTYTMNYHQNRAWYLNHTWSLSVEEQFYLLWPALLLLLSPARAMRAAVAMIFAAPIIRAGMFFYFDATPTALGRQFQAVADALACGCILAGFYNRLGQVSAYIRWQQFPLYPLLPLALLAASGLTYKLSSPFYYIAGQSIANIACFLLLDYAVRRSQSPIGALLNTRLCSLLGAWSYSLYLWQELFLDYEPTGLRIPFPLNLIFVFATALFSYYFVERVFFGLRHRFDR